MLVTVSALALAVGLVLVPDERDSTPPDTEEGAVLAARTRSVLPQRPWAADLARGPRIASFNILGANHTSPRGNKSEWRDYDSRLKGAEKLLRRQRISVAGLQEFQGPQRDLFFELTTGWRLSPEGNETNGIIWRHRQWQLLKAWRVRVPYFKGRPEGMPYVLLRHRRSGKRIWFINVHNPSSAKGPAKEYRRIALQREAALVRRLRATGRPVVLLGDLNQREEAFCYLARRGMSSSAGGSWDKTRRRRGKPACQPPRDVRLDWIFGQGTWARLGGHRVDTRARTRGVSDHPVVISSLPAFRVERRRGSRG